ncbi:hypothetical protein MACH17_14760 [Phaeobacter inhibens]|uniref:hypothetical protein n=1 Tax=Phaeobacter inhibens TaxID=221822 RepID=UPI00276B22D8|nr:hypothetical protein [Phaeobacter inhibens]GLO69959.1 hypothetical protein MACH17_14760 [Phaeobacter inhibens]
MKTKVRAIAGGIGICRILLFWTSTVLRELFASHETMAAVKGVILRGMSILTPGHDCRGCAGAQAISKKGLFSQ